MTNVRSAIEWISAAILVVCVIVIVLGSFYWLTQW